MHSVWGPPPHLLLYLNRPHRLPGAKIPISQPTEGERKPRHFKVKIEVKSDQGHSALSLGGGDRGGGVCSEGGEGGRGR